MDREDRYTNTPEDAAEYERTVFGDDDRGYRDDRPSPSELARDELNVYGDKYSDAEPSRFEIVPDDERETCAGCDRPVYRDEARRTTGGAYVCDDCAPHIHEPRP